jgi:hypothetical protein
VIGFHTLRGATMKAAVEVKDKAEAGAVKAAMGDPETRAFVVVTGVLNQLPTAAARDRVLRYVKERMAEDAAEGGAS